MSRLNSAILFIYRDEWIKLTVHFTFILGNLYIHGYESKRGEQESNKFNSLYTHEIEIKKVNINNLCVALKLKTTSKDELFMMVKERFSGKNGLYKLTDFLKDRGIEFLEYPNSNM